ncbi:hypothetical protein Gasu2_44250 [Galdieria sulphuraria]|uniref:GIY-YIG domain-containing protein n=1 Tax=Galdieria sulphuraria TaxID=130081 RepID=M2X4X8_GALSU|nr:hypothetical protein Gasu_12010 isoform 2 [Galdieria sulphuraria]EME31525.1 hypothetical protein isoform 2 [Galdieria sulphuraria]GJD10218.1 hypothetical protein Gasu2_44250 [Galdieria sulphuraria]|eukprot:XP_005708045.1 hypothetical protein isoform 2 [Galdieria sulphuraria]
MSTNHKSRPRYLQELPMIPIDEIYAKSFRWNRTGCYALYNDDHLLCYVGYTKNLQKKIAFHAKLQPNQCKFFKAYVVDNPKVSASFLEKILDSWLLEYGSVPPGNSSERHLWEGKRERRGTVEEKVQSTRADSTTSSRVNDFFDGKDPFALRSKFSKNMEREDYLQTWIPLATVVGLSVLLWLMGLVTTSLQPDTLGL